MKQDFEEQYNSLFDMAKLRLLRLLKIKQMATKHFKMHQKRFLNHITKELDDNEDNQLAL